MMREYNLEIGTGPTKYDPKRDPRVSNEFATVIFSSLDLLIFLCHLGGFPLWPLTSTERVSTIC